MPVHINAQNGDIAPYVLLPGDPNRATYIAETFFDTPKRYTEYRNMFGYTGSYKGKPVSVQTSGMGTPSTSIITEELIMLGAKHIVRIGTCGGLNDNLQLGDAIIATTAWGSREIVEEIAGFGHFCPQADIDHCMVIRHMLGSRNFRTHLGPICSVNLFYADAEKHYRDFIKMGCLALEMEAAALFTLAAKHGIKANCLLAVSDLFDQDTMLPERLPEQEIRNAVDNIVELALDSYICINAQ